MVVEMNLAVMAAFYLAKEYRHAKDMTTFLDSMEYIETYHKRALEAASNGMVDEAEECLLKMTTKGYEAGIDTGAQEKQVYKVLEH